MSYLRCTACGAKALSAASQCPRCTTPFALTDARGRRVPLTPCRGCGYLHRVDTPCHWCGVLPPPTWQRPAVWRRGAGVVLALGVAVAVWRAGFPLPSSGAPRTDRPRTSVPPVAAVAPVAAPSSVTPVTTDTAAAPLPRDQAVPATDLPISAAPSTTIPAVAAATASPAADTVRWVPAVARTWVNVRANASRDGAVVGVISPSSRAMLEAGRSGWRRVRAPDVHGWVDPRLFVADSSARRDG